MLVNISFNEGYVVSALLVDMCGDSQGSTLDEPEKKKM